ncbi:hypothetical protein [Novosphingobium sp. ZW T3_23]|uniref:hypothetical protein n=1 Tax=Novosphingobium sp. ZW T3_23 TaxID=3378084 RepID=UPI0038540572
MNEIQLDLLVDKIDQLLSEYLELRSADKNLSEEIATGRILPASLFPRDEADSVSRRALLSIGETLALVGGIDLMLRVHTAYENKFGVQRANSLSARWDSAAELWYH